MAAVEMSETKGPGDNAEPGKAQREGSGSKYRIAIVLGVIAVSFYVLSIVSIMFSRGVGGG